MIEFINVTKYNVEHGRKRYILKNASFVIPDNSKLALMSNSRSDGLIFLKMLMRIIPPDSGSIVTDSKISWIVGSPVGMVDSLSARRNINIICGLNGLGRTKANRIADMVADFTGLGAHLDDPMSTYKTEMKSRVSFALSLALQFDYLLVHNKLCVGSDKFRKKSRSALLEAIGGSGLILGSTNMKLARELCDCCLVFNKGIVTLHDEVEQGIAAFQKINSKRKKKARKTARKTARKARKKASRRRKNIMDE